MEGHNLHLYCIILLLSKSDRQKSQQRKYGCTAMPNQKISDLLVVRSPFSVVHDAGFQNYSRYGFRDHSPAAPSLPWWFHFANAVENRRGFIQDIQASDHETPSGVEFTIPEELLAPHDQTGEQIEEINHDRLAANLNAGLVDFSVDRELLASDNHSDPALSTSAALGEEVVEKAAEVPAIQTEDFIQLDEMAVIGEADEKASSFTLYELYAYLGNHPIEDRESASISSASVSSQRENENNASGDQTEVDSSPSIATIIATRIMAIKDALPSFTYKEMVMYKQELSSGSYGRVYIAITKLGRIAIKTLKAEKMATLTLGEVDMHIRHLYEEAHLLYCLRHPNILTFYTMISNFENGYPGMAMELMSENSLYHCLQRGDPRVRSWAGILNVAQQVVEAMAYLHDYERSIVHFDLKTCNILVEYESSNPTYPICRVGDFGLAMVNERVPLHNGRIPLTSSRGTVIYMAPEVILAKHRPNQITFVTEKVDVYSFAMLMWELMMGEIPYRGMPTEQVEINVIHRGMRPHMPAQCIWGWQGLMEDCWAEDEVQRPNFNEIRTRLNDIILQYNHDISMNARQGFRN